MFRILLSLTCLIFAVSAQIQTNICASARPCGDYPCENAVLSGITFYFCYCGDDDIRFNNSCSDTEATCDPPCLNGGICSLKPDEGPPKCECPANFTGEFCQTGVISTTQIINTTTPAKPCNVNNLCLNNGTCVNVDNKNGFICQCKPEFEGVLCEVEKENICIRDKPCGDDKCEWFAAQSSYICYCSNGYIVLNRNCTNATTCFLSCQNGGYCSFNELFKPVCTCPPDYTGELCETKFNIITSPCDVGNPCLNDGVCLKYTEGGPQSPTFYCQCPKNYTGLLCEYEISNVCTETTCLNNGICSNTQNGFVCTCAPGFSGPTCASPFEPCTVNTCNENGLCVPSTLFGAYCICFTGYTGKYCDSGPCEILTPCLNNATCNNNRSVSIGYTCTCPSNYHGSRCEEEGHTPGPCDKMQPCLNGGTCENTPSSPNGFVCICPFNFIGETCDKYYFPGPCDRLQPCQHGGTCVKSNSSIYGFYCNCQPQYVGELCEIFSPSPGPCDKMQQCQNGGTCVNTNTTLNGFKCICPKNYTGETCEIDFIYTPSPCDRMQPCMNDGLCVKSNNSLNGFYCNCTSGYYGALCEYVYTPGPCDKMQPCLNGGSCINTNSSLNGYICQCPISHKGKYCELALHTPGPCDRMAPCLNNATCINDNSTFDGFICQCPPNYFGKLCEQMPPSSACNFIQASSCLNGGTCMTSNSTILGFLCKCPPGIGGLFCEKVSGLNFSRIIDCDNDIYECQSSDSLSQNSSFCNSLRPCNEYNSKCIDLQRGTIDFTKPTHLCLCKNNATIGYPSCKTEIHKFAKNNASFEIIQNFTYCALPNACNENKESICIELPTSVKITSKIPYLCLCSNSTMGYPNCHRKVNYLKPLDFKDDDDFNDHIIEYEGQKYESRIIEAIVNKWIEATVQKSFRNFIRDLKH